MNTDKYGPALKYRSELYPILWEDKVPKKVKMTQTVYSDIPVFMLKHEKPLVAEKNIEYECWVNSHGAVSAILADGQRLGLKPNEFEIIEWHEQNQEPLLKYFISYRYIKSNSETGFGRTKINRDNPIRDITDIESIERSLKKYKHFNDNDQIFVMQWKHFEEDHKISELKEN